MTRVTELGQLLDHKRRLLFRDEEAPCERCGSPVATRRMLQRLDALLADGNPRPPRLCIACKGY